MYHHNVLWKTHCYLMVHLGQSMFVSSTLRTLGYTTLMGAPPKVQPKFVSST